LSPANKRVSHELTRPSARAYTVLSTNQLKPNALKIMVLLALMTRFLKTVQKITQTAKKLKIHKFEFF